MPSQAGTAAGRLKLGTVTYSYLWQTSLDEAIARIAKLGFRTVEIMAAPPHAWPRDLDAARRREIRRLCDELQVTVTALNPTFLDLNLCSTNPAIRDETVAQLCETVDLAADLGAGAVVVAVGQRHPLIAPPNDWFWKMAREGISRCLDICEKRRVYFALENAWTVIDRAQQLMQMVEEIDHQWLGICFDVANAAMVQSPYDGLYVVADRLIHVHLSDTDYRVWGHNPIGYGVVDFSRVAEILREIGYKGNSILELVYPQDADGGLLRSAAILEKVGWTR